MTCFQIPGVITLVMRMVRDVISGPDVLAEAESIRTWRRDGAVKLRMADDGPLSEVPESVITVFRTTVRRMPNLPALGQLVCLGFLMCKRCKISLLLFAVLFRPSYGLIAIIN